jgi:hypothetical protein
MLVHKFNTLFWEIYTAVYVEWAQSFQTPFIFP